MSLRDLSSGSYANVRIVNVMKKQKTCNNVIFINFYQDTQCKNDKQLLVKINLNLKDRFKKLTEIQFIKL